MIGFWNKSITSRLRCIISVSLTHIMNISINPKATNRGLLRPRTHLTAICLKSGCLEGGFFLLNLRGQDISCYLCGILGGGKELFRGIFWTKLYVPDSRETHYVICNWNLENLIWYSTKHNSRLRHLFSNSINVSESQLQKL